MTTTHPSAPGHLRTSAPGRRSSSGHLRPSRADEATFAPLRWPADRAAVRSLYDAYAAWFEEQAGSSLWAVQPTALLERTDPTARFARPGLLLLARVGPQVVGMAGVRAVATGVGELGPCFVLPGARRAGLGRRLAGHALEAAQRRGFTRIEADAVPEHLPDAFVLYRSLGFTVVGRRSVPQLATDVVAMALELDAGPATRGDRR